MDEPNKNQVTYGTGIDILIKKRISIYQYPSHSLPIASLYRLSAGGIQYARNKLEKLDLIEKHNNIWQIVDPVFGCWLAGH